jgi:hypothetical protein
MKEEKKIVGALRSRYGYPIESQTNRFQAKFYSKQTNFTILNHIDEITPSTKTPRHIK